MIDQSTSNTDVGLLTYRPNILIKVKMSTKIQGI